MTGGLVLVAVIMFAGKASATGNVTGYLGGWSTDAAGNPSYVDFISMSDVTNNIGYAYGVTIPAADGLLSGYAYDGGLGSYVAFDNSGGYLDGCPAGHGYARRVGNSLMGFARIVSIAQAGANAGGWDGCILLDGVDITRMDGTGANPTYAWAGDHGWIDFSRASITPPPASCTLGGTTVASGGSINAQKQIGCGCGSLVRNCLNGVLDGDASYNSDTCSNLPAISGACGSSNGGTFSTAPNTNLCNAGSASALSGSGPWTWTCSGICGGAVSNPPCSANKDNPSGWREVAP